MNSMSTGDPPAQGITTNNVSANGLWYVYTDSNTGDWEFGDFEFTYPQPQHDWSKFYSGHYGTGGSTTIIRITEESKQEEGVKMKGLFNVIVVTKKEKVLVDVKVVAEDADEAKFLADVSEKLKSNGLKPSEVTILCNKMGDIKVDAEPKKVQIVKD